MDSMHYKKQAILWTKLSRSVAMNAISSPDSVRNEQAKTEYINKLYNTPVKNDSKIQCVLIKGEIHYIKYKQCI